MSSPAPDSSLLPEETARRIFEEQIVRFLLSDAFPAPAPRAVVLVGQPGAGTTMLAHTLADEFTDSRPVIIAMDDLRSFYPEHADLQRALGSAEADRRAQQDAHRWLLQTLDYLREQRSAHVIVEDDLEDVRTAAAVTNQLTRPTPHPSGNYDIEVAFVATPTARSRLMLLERTQLSLERIGRDNYLGDQAHDRRNANLASVAAWADTASAITRTSVYRGADGQLIYRRARDQTADSLGHLSPTPHPTLDLSTASVPAVIEAVRNQGWTAQESKDWLRLHGSLKIRMNREWSPSLTQARRDAELLLNPGAYARSSLEAVTLGRYQLVTAWHMDAIAEMLLTHDHVTIGVIDFDDVPETTFPAPAGLERFYLERQLTSARELNPLTASERVAMWNAALVDAGLDTQVAVETIRRPELDPAGFSTRFPKDRFQLVLPDSRSDGEIDSRAHHAYQQILDRVVTTVDPPMEYHGADLREMYLIGNPAWMNLVRGTAALLAIDGHRRLFEQAPPEAIQFHATPADSEAAERIAAVIDRAFAEHAINDDGLSAAALPHKLHNRRITDTFNVGASTTEPRDSNPDANPDLDPPSEAAPDV
ncbi:zeta toxin family protein [Nocardia suismassiliense]|uniref:zeta toxin family protein n=1 Tax=Nocardia suismassiliense TaxID=2077092 RepID=UPI00131EFF0B|nr:zeta toxin family protein [Nocardia suismassiliense]